MKEEQTIIEKLDEAINSESTSIEIRELLINAKTELINAKSKNDKFNVALKIAKILGVFTRVLVQLE